MVLLYGTEQAPNIIMNLAYVPIKATGNEQRTSVAVGR